LCVKSSQVGSVVLLQLANLAQQKNRPTQRAATVLFVKAVVVFYLVGKEK
jgi:hypothetical protein